MRNVSAASGEVAAVKHVSDIPAGDAFAKWVVEGVFNHPFVDGFALRQRVLETTNGPFGGALNNAVNRDKVVRLQGATQHFSALGQGNPTRDIEGALLCGHLADDLQLRVACALRPVGIENFHVGDRVAIDACVFKITLPAVAERAFPEGVFVLR